MINFKNENNLDNEISKYKKITIFISIIRFIIAISLIISLICLFSIGNYYLYGTISIILLVTFIMLILFTNKYYKKYSLLNKKKQIYQNHYNRRNNNLNLFHDTGNEFINKDDDKSSDLDIFGKNSLVQYLNVAKTYYGRRLLKKQLTNPDTMSIDFIKSVYYLANEEKSLDI